MTSIRIDLFSDTQTRPTPEMRRAMAEAEVGDEQMFEDPSVNRLCETVADLLQKEAAVFMPSGTMCNEIAILVHCRPGEEIVAHRTAHILNFEGGGPAALAGAVIAPQDGAGGVFSGAQLEAAVRPAMRHAPQSRLVSVEQTSNFTGGSVWPLEAVHDVAAAARARGLALHMDGARLMNAVVASGVPAREWAEPFDSAWIDLSKGLGCPVGAVLAGSADFVDRAWRWKQRMGGALRQAGILAAAGLHALAHHVERLEDDHANARRFADLAREAPGVRVDPPEVPTNIVFLDVSGTGIEAPRIADALLERGIRIGAMGAGRMRACTHLDVDEAGVEEAGHAFVDAVTRLGAG